MSVITLEQLKKIMPNAGKQADNFLKAINRTCSEFSIQTPIRSAAFLAQIAHESNELRFVRENMNYSAIRLSQVWPTRFARRDIKGNVLVGQPNDLAVSIGHKPEAIANIVYADRLGNGAPASFDGWCYRGGGLIQLTGRAHYAECGIDLEIPLEANPELIEQPEVSARTAGWFWNKNHLNNLADIEDFKGISGIINVGNRKALPDRIKGFQERIRYWERAKKVLGC